MTDKTSDFEANKAAPPDGTDPHRTVNLGSDADTSPHPFLHTVSAAATPSALLDFKLLEAGAETVTYPRSFGAYDLLEEIARGGMGVVFKAKQRGLDRTVALKMILGLQDHGTSAARFVEEARAIAALDHPNVVPIFDIGEIGGRMYFTMPFVNGPSLKALVEKGGVPPVAKAVSLFVQTAAGMAQAHRQGIMHRDLKPANVLVDADGRPRVADFGLAKRAGDADRANMTGTGQLMGTPAYMSPEQARDSKDVTPATDVYSLGAILYFLLTGHAPFAGDTIPDLLIQVLQTPPPSPTADNPAVPDDVAAVCLKCLAKSPADRYPDAVALSDALAPLAERYMSRSGIQNSPLSTPLLDSVSMAGATTVPTTPPTASAEPRPSRKPLGVLLALAAVAVGVGVVFWPKGDRKVDDKSVATTTPPVVPDKPDDSPRTPRTTVPPQAGDDQTWPAPKGDFGLSIEMRAQAEKDKAGVLHLAAGSFLELQLRADADCWVYVFVVEQDDTATLLFPYEKDEAGKLVAGHTRVVPSDAYHRLKATPTVGPGVERVRVVASTKPLPPLPPGAKVGNFQQFANDAQKAGLRSMLRRCRGLEVVPVEDPKATPTNGKLAEAELQFHVK